MQHAPQKQSCLLGSSPGQQLPKGRAQLPPPIHTMRSVVTVPSRTNLLIFKLLRLGF